MRIRGSKTTALAVAAAGLVMSAAAANAVNLTVGSGGPVGPGGSVSISVTLQSEGSAVAGTQNDIAFAPEAAIRASSAGKPLCSVNPAIDKSATAFSFQPPRCTVGTDCTAIRALVLSLSNVDAIPDGSNLYNCDIAIAADTERDQEYPLTCSGAGSSDPAGVALQTACTDGTVTVSGGTPTPAPTNTPTNTPINTVAVATATRTAGTGGGDVDDGCAITAPAQSQAGWLLVFPAAMLLWLRRRSR